MRFSIKQAVGVVGVALAGVVSSEAAVSVTAADLDYGISGKQNNNFFSDFSTSTVWTAGSQRSENGSADANNRRAGRVFVEFQLDAAIIAAAAEVGATVSLTFNVDSIGAGVAGTPYTNGLDLRFLGTAAADQNAATLWSVFAVGADQADILLTTGSTGSHVVALTNPNVLSSIAGATVGDYLAFGMSNSSGWSAADLVGNSTAETYGFQINQTTSNHTLTVIPEAGLGSISCVSLLLLSLLRRRS